MSIRSSVVGSFRGIWPVSVMLPSVDHRIALQYSDSHLDYGIIDSPAGMFWLPYFKIDSA